MSVISPPHTYTQTQSPMWGEKPIHRETEYFPFNLSGWLVVNNNNNSC